MPSPKALPLVPQDLLEALEKRYPEACAEPGQTMDQLMFYGGKRDLIRWLRLQFEDQQHPSQDDEDEE
jgi:hypothetical protein